MAQYMFGVGSLVIGTGASAVTVGTLQDVSLEINATTKKLMGPKRFPVDVAVGPTTVSGRAKIAQIQGGLIQQALGASGSATGMEVLNQDMGATTVFQIEWTGTFRSKTAKFTLGACVIPKLGFGFRNEDYGAVDLDFEGFADSNGKIIDITTAE